MPRYDAVVWDWNGTLLDDVGLCAQVINMMLGKRGLPPVSGALYRALLEFPVILFYNKLGFDFTQEPFETISNEYVALYQDGWRGCSLQTGARSAMESLRAKGIRQSVLSASKTSHLQEQLEYFGVQPIMDVVTGVENHHGHGKLHLAREHIGLLGADPKRTLFIGDTAHDAEVADEAGCECLFVSFGHYSRERLNRPDNRVMSKMNDVAEYILNSDGSSPNIMK